MNTVIITVAASVGLLLVAVLAMAVKVLLVRNGRFPRGHVCRMDSTLKNGSVNKTA